MENSQSPADSSISKSNQSVPISKEYEDMDSEERAQEELRVSYNEYEKIIQNKRKKKKLDLKIKKLKIKEEDDLISNRSNQHNES